MKQDALSSLYASLSRVEDPTVKDVLRQHADAIAFTVNQSRTFQSAPAPKQLSLAQIKAALQASGSNPLVLTGLPGQAPATQFGTHLARPAAANSPIGAFYLETDRTSLYVNETVANIPAWVYVAGLYAATFASRPTDLGTNDTGFLFYANGDTPSYNTVFRWDGAKWAVEYGTMRGTLSPDQKPTLTADDFGFLFYATDFDRTYRWSGTVWLDYGSEGRGIYMLYEAPATAGWHLADGTAGVSRSKSDGTTTTITLPDLTSAANKYAYFKTNVAYSNVVQAAVAPVFTGSPDTTSSDSAGTPAGTVASSFFGSPGTTGIGSAGTTVQSGAGASVSGSGHTHGFTPAGTVSSTFTGSPMAGHSHTVTPTGTNDTSGEPQHLNVLCYFRL